MIGTMKGKLKRLKQRKGSCEEKNKDVISKRGQGIHRNTYNILATNANSK